MLGKISTIYPLGFAKNFQMNVSMKFTKPFGWWEEMHKPYDWAEEY